MTSFKQFLLEKADPKLHDFKIDNQVIARYNPDHSGYDWEIIKDGKNVGWINFSTVEMYDGKKYHRVNASDLDAEVYTAMMNNFLNISTKMGSDGIISFEKNPVASNHETFKRTSKIKHALQRVPHIKQVQKGTYILEK